MSAAPHQSQHVEVAHARRQFDVRSPMPSARSVLLALAACVCLAGLLAATPATAAPPRDQFEGLVDVGGHRLYVHCEGRGGPTVILEAALGTQSATWNLVQPEIARFTTVCSYDRANLGRSDRAPIPRTAQTAVDELRALLVNAGIRGPYVLVGSSYGGWIVQLLARQDAGRRVSGVVLVDATPSDFPQIADRLGLPPRPSSRTPRASICAPAAARCWQRRDSPRSRLTSCAGPSGHRWFRPSWSPPGTNARRRPPRCHAAVD